MARTKQGDTLEISQDLDQQRLEWRIERMGWTLMVLTLLAALAGLLGNGPLSRRQAGDKNSLWVEYNRFERYQAPAMLRLHLGPKLTGRDEVRVSVSRQYIEAIQLEHVDPEPKEVEARADRILYTFKIKGPDATALTYHLKGNVFGSVPLHLQVEGAGELKLSQFFYP